MLESGGKSHVRKCYKRGKTSIVNIACCWKHSFHLCICSAQSENLDNSGIALRKVRIPKLADKVRILTLRGSIPELSVAATCYDDSFHGQPLYFKSKFC